jgi:hypothetical protein
MGIVSHLRRHYVGRTSRNAFSQRVPSTAAPLSGLSLICLREQRPLSLGRNYRTAVPQLGERPWAQSSSIMNLLS